MMSSFKSTFKLYFANAMHFINCSHYYFIHSIIFIFDIMRMKGKYYDGPPSTSFCMGMKIQVTFYEIMLKRIFKKASLVTNYCYL